MMEIVYGAVYTTITTLITFAFFHVFSEVRTSKKRVISGLVIWILGLIALSNLFVEHLVAKTILVAVYGGLVPACIFRVRVYKSFVLYAIYTGIGWLCDMCAIVLGILIVPSFRFETMQDSAISVFLASLSVGLQILVVVILQKVFYKKVSGEVATKLFEKTVLFSAFTLAINISVIFNYDSSLSRGIQYLFLFVTLGFVLLNILVFLILRDIYVNEIEQKNARIESEKYNHVHQLYNQMMEQYQAQKKREHDIRNHLSVISMLAKENKNDKLENYLKEYSAEISEDVLHSGNVILDAIINSKYAEMKKKEIEFIFSIEPLKGNKVSEVDMTTVLSNLLDNAVEACTRMEKGRRYVKLVIEQFGDSMNIFVSNSYDGKIKEQDGVIETLKQDKKVHGIGLINVREIIEKYDGYMELAYDNEEFRVNISI